MKIGVCAPPDRLPLLKEMGYDYIESNFSWLASLSEADYRHNTALLEASGLASESFNGFFPGGIKLYAPGGDQTPLLRDVEAFCEGAFARAASWGGKVAVIGSGYVRGIPEGMTWEECDVQFSRVFSVCARVAAKYGMRVTVEPLSRNECNYIHTVAEGAKIARAANHPAACMMVDFYHHWKNGEDPATLPDNADLLIHAHYARPVDRDAPYAENLADLQAVLEAVKACPGMERMSLECTYRPDFTTALERARPLMEMFHTVS